MKVATGDVVIVTPFDDVPEHLFLVEDVHEDCVTGVAQTGLLAGEYGEPELALEEGRKSVSIQYAYLQQQTWRYRRNYPKESQGEGWNGPLSGRRRRVMKGWLKRGLLP